jgi:hypothetical protein
LKFLEAFTIILSIYTTLDIQEIIIRSFFFIWKYPWIVLLTNELVSLL